MTDEERPAFFPPARFVLAGWMVAFGAAAARGCNPAAFLQNVRRGYYELDTETIRPTDSHRVDRTRVGALNRRRSGFTMPDPGIVHLARDRQLV